MTKVVINNNNSNGNNNKLLNNRRPAERILKLSKVVLVGAFSTWVLPGGSNLAWYSGSSLYMELYSQSEKGGWQPSTQHPKSRYAEW